MTRTVVVVLSLIALGFIALPVIGLLIHLAPADMLRALQTPAATSALELSALTTLLSLGLTVVFGTPLAWVLARTALPGRPIFDAIVDVPIVIPPAVAGLALLLVFGRLGTFGSLLHSLGIQLSFSTAAVVLAQTFVASPFYVRAARSGFLSVDRTLEAAAATLGMGPLRTFALVTIPLCAPALLGGAVLSWARALGEFGATIMFAGNLVGVSQTVPLAVYLNLESGNLPIATALSIVLMGLSFLVVIAVRLLEPRRARD